MKHQLVYLFILAAPLLVQLLSRDTTSADAAVSATDPAPVAEKAELQTEEKQPSPAPERKPAKKTPPPARRIPAPQAYTFM